MSNYTNYRFGFKMVSKEEAPALLSELAKVRESILYDSLEVVEGNNAVYIACDYFTCGNWNHLARLGFKDAQLSKNLIQLEVFNMLKLAKL